MKNLRLIFILALSVLITSCDKDDDNNNTPLEGTSFQATINGGSFSNYSFNSSVYNVTKGNNGNTMQIDIADANGEQLTLFLNGTNGFANGTIKVMGNMDSNNFTTYSLFRQQSPQTSYFSSSGNVTITDNRAHPTESGKRLISGDFNITTSPIEDDSELTMTGSFSELEYLD